MATIESWTILTSYGDQIYSFWNATQVIILDCFAAVVHEGTNRMEPVGTDVLPAHRDYVF